uniref:Zinc finger, CCHC-type n=1 Tax=Tanacetum cinerariifolium TaxID=118510 RepID=A0A6L2MV87_TANCI|nr:zinc finger, CCHC-type [Tanacetum cinerariifolium]
MIVPFHVRFSPVAEAEKPKTQQGRQESRQTEDLDHVAQWGNLIGKIVRGFLMHYPSWHKIEPEKKAGVIGTFKTHFDLTPHMQSKLWPKIQKDIEQHLAKVYVDNKSSLKKEHLVLKPDGTRGNAARALQNAKNHAKSKVFCRHGSQLLAVHRDMQMESSETREYPSLVLAYFDTRIVDDGRQWGHILSVGRFLAKQGRDVISINEPQFMHTDTDVDKLESQHKVGGSSGSVGGGDDEPGADEDDDNDEDTDGDEENWDMLYIGDGKKDAFLLTTLKAIYVLTTSMPELLEDATVKAIRIRVKWDYICRGHVLNGMSDSLLMYIRMLNRLRSCEILLNPSTWQGILQKRIKIRTTNKTKERNVISNNMVVVRIPTRNLGWNVRSVVKLVTLKGIAVVVIRKTQMLVVREKGLRTIPKTKVVATAWWIDSDATTHVYSVYMSSSTVVISSLSHARLGHVHYKRMLEMSKDDLIPAIDENPKKCTTYDASRFCYVFLLHAKDESLDKFRIYKTEVELKQNDLIKTLRTDRGGEYYDPVFFQSLEIIYETTAPYTPQQNGVAERKSKALKKMVNSMLSYLGLSEGFWGEAMLTACYLLNRIPNKRNKTTPYELWYKKRPNLSFLRVWGCRAVVRLPDPKRKTLGEKGINCIFVGYAKHFKAYMFYVIEPNDSISINSIIESRDAIFDENCFSSIPRPKDIIPNVQESQIDDHTDDVPNEIPELRKGCKWIFKRNMKVDGTIDKFKARLVIQGFRQKEGIDYFDTYIPVVRITTIRLLLALAAIHNLVIYQMDVKTTFLNGDLDEEVYIKQPEGFGEADVILGIKIKRENKRIVITQSHYIEKILKKFNREDCSPVSTPMHPVEKLKPNTGKPVDQLEYSRAIGCLMYAMTSTRPDIAYVVGRLSRYLLVLEGYSDASWINHIEDSSSMSGWVFLLGGGAISWAFKKQTCITSSTIESEFVALAATGKEVEWLRNLIHEILI